MRAECVSVPEYFFEGGKAEEGREELGWLLTVLAEEDEAFVISAPGSKRFKAVSSWLSVKVRVWFTTKD